MEAAFSELPLAVFTTCVLLGAGAFVVRGLVFAGAGVPEERAGAYDRLAFVPVGITVLGFIAVTLHVTTPLHAVYALTGVGHSPLTNEIVVGGLFLVVALVFSVLAAAGKLSGASRKVLAIATAVLAVLFAVFVGLAYLVDTIVSWNTAWTVLEPVGYALFAGAVLEVMLLELAGCGQMLAGSMLSKVVAGFALLGAIVGFGALAAHVAAVSGMQTAAVSGGVLAQGTLAWVGAAAALALVALACVFVAMRRSSGGIAAFAFVVALAAVFAGRMVFYALQMSVGL